MKYYEAIIGNQRIGVYGNEPTTGHYKYDLNEENFLKLWKRFILGKNKIYGEDIISYIRKLSPTSINRVFNIMSENLAPEKSLKADNPEVAFKIELSQLFPFKMKEFEERILKPEEEVIIEEFNEDEDQSKEFFGIEEVHDEENNDQEIKTEDLIFEMMGTKEHSAKDLLHIAIETNQLEVARTLFDKFQVNFNDSHRESLKRSRQEFKDASMSILVLEKTVPSVYLKKCAVPKLFILAKDAIKDEYTDNKLWEEFLDFLNKQPSQIKDFINASDERGKTLLHLATQNAPLEIVQALVNKGARCNVVNHLKQTPLHIAALLDDHFNKAKYLASKFPETLNLKDKFGNTPLLLMRDNLTRDEVDNFISKFSDLHISQEPAASTPSTESDPSKYWTTYLKMKAKFSSLTPGFPSSI